MAPTAAPSLSASGSSRAWNCSDEPKRAAARDDDLGAGQLGPLGLATSRPRRSSDLPGAPASTASTRARAALGRRLLERGAADGDHLLRVGRLDRGDGVAGIDRAGEGVVALDREDVGNLHHVEQGGDARRDILAGGGRRARGRRRDRPSARRRSARHSRRAGARGARRRRHGPCRRRRSSRRPRRRAPTPDPATSRWTSPSCDAAVTVASVASLIAPPSCSTRTSVFISPLPAP